MKKAGYYPQRHPHALKERPGFGGYVNEKRPHTPVILITGYSDFEYAQTAIKNRVFDYILKPVEPDKLIASVQRAQKNLELEEKHQRLYTVFQEYFASNLETVRRQFIEGFCSARAPIWTRDQQRETFQLDFTTYRLVAVGCSTAIERRAHGGPVLLHIPHREIYPGASS